MLKKILSFLFILSIFLVGSIQVAQAQIIIEDASTTWEQALESPEAIPLIPLRVVCEYATTIYHGEFACPEELLEVTSSVPARIVVEYATTIAHLGLNEVILCDWSELCVMAADFGRIDCGLGDPCEYNYDGDNDVDGSDLAEFITNF